MDGIKKTPSLTNFFKIMRPCPELRGLKAKELQSLLVDLRKVAVRKQMLEAAAECSRSRVQRLRHGREGFLALGDHLAKASIHLQTACQQREQLLVVEQELPMEMRLKWSEFNVPPKLDLSANGVSRAKTDSERIAAYLMAASVSAKEYAAHNAAAIHPSSRTLAERKAAKEWHLRFNVSDQDGYPLIGTSTPAIDHWFIGAANSCLLEFEGRLGAGLNVTNRVRILTHLFEVLFRETKSPDSIRKELDRQKKNGAPEYRWPAWLEDPIGDRK